MIGGDSRRRAGELRAPRVPTLGTIFAPTILYVIFYDSWMPARLSDVSSSDWPDAVAAVPKPNWPPAPPRR